MRQRVDSVCRASFIELRRTASIRLYLSQSATAGLVAAMITSRLDYCNSVSAGLPAVHIARLRRTKNNAARLVMKKKKAKRKKKKNRKRAYVTLLLRELHWLPVKFRCRYKIATLAYRHFEGSLPPYLPSSLCTYKPSRSLRSSKEKLSLFKKKSYP